MKQKGFYLILLTALVSGVSIFLNKFGVSNTNPFTYTLAKNAVAAALLYTSLIFLKETDLRKLTRRQWSKLFVIGLTGGSIPFLLFFGGLSITSAAKAAFIHKTMFVYASILAIHFLKEKFNSKMMFGAFLLLLGNAVFLGITPENLNTGDIMVFAATILWAAENVISKHALKDIPPKTVAFGRMFFGSLIITLFLAATGQLGGITALTAQEIGWILLASAFLFLYVLFWYTGLAHVSVSVATAVLLLGSPITTLLSVTFLGDTVTLPQAAGMLLTVLGVVLMVQANEVLKRFVSILENVFHGRS